MTLNEYQVRQLLKKAQQAQYWTNEFCKNPSDVHAQEYVETLTNEFRFAMNILLGTDLYQEEIDKVIHSSKEPEKEDIVRLGRINE